MGSDASLNGAASLCDCPLRGKKMRSRGSPLNRLSEMLKCEAHSGVDRCKGCGGGLMKKETMDHDILQGIIIASSAWHGVELTYPTATHATETFMFERVRSENKLKPAACQSQWHLPHDNN